MNYITIIEKMKECFPRWMDIRRKIKTSTGGNYLYALAEETAEIEKAINDYRREFFIDNYLESCEEITDFLYRANIGIVPVEAITVEGYSTIDDQKLFYENDKVAYYEDGFIYIKEPVDFINIEFYGYKSQYELEKQHVWNVYDEFAIFLGLKRYENETNKELLNRILSYSNGKPNSTEDGLKHAIISDLINIDNTLAFEDIKIERQTATSLVKYYDEFETILDRLSRINKDTFKEKQWDIDIWKLGVNKIDYIPHAWDVALEAYSNGVGFDNDLLVKLIDDKQETDVTLTFYKKKLEAINAYIQNNNIKEKINLTLKQYDSVLDPERVRYKISATPAKIINTRDINANAIEKRIGVFSIPIDEVADPFLFGVNKEDMAVIDSNYNYKIDLVPVDPLKEFFIEELKIDNDGAITDLINYNQHGFEEFNGGIKNSKTRAYIQDKYMFSELDNIDKEVDGFVIHDLTRPGEAVILAGKHKNRKMFFEYECKKASVLLKDMKFNNCYIKGDKIVADTVIEEKSIEIDIIGNELEFNISGNFTIEYRINEDEIQTIDRDQNNYKFTIPRTITKNRIRARILFKEAGESNFIKDIMFSAFDIEVSTEGIPLIKENDYFIIPNDENAKISFKMEAFTGFSPCINWIYIGERLAEQDGIYNIEVNSQGKSRINAKVHNCRIDLHKVSKAGEAISTVKDFKPFVFYSSESNSNQVELFLDDFDEIRTMTAEHGVIETVSYSSYHLQYILKLEPGKKISHITVSGMRNSTISTINIHNVLKEKGYEDTAFDFYCSEGLKYIIAKHKTNGLVKNISITKSDICKGYNVSIVRMDMGSNEDISPVYIENENNKTSTIKLESLDNFDIVSFTPINSKEYIALNEHNVIFNLTTDIKIINIFSNGYNDETSLMLYKVQSLDDKYMVRFQSAGSFEIWSEEALGIHDLAIQRKDINSASFNYRLVSIDAELPLASAIEIPKEFILGNNEKIDIKKYMIANDYDIAYINKYMDLENEDMYTCSELLFVDDLMFSKLKYSNIYEIESLTYINNDEIITLAEGVDYKLHKREGIITWINKSIKDMTDRVSIEYNFEIAEAILVDIDDVYKKIQYNVIAYEKIDEIKIDRVGVNTSIDLKAFESYREADLTNVKTTDIGFDATVKDGFLTLEKNAVRNTVSVKSGFYYMNGVEHYLFADEKFDEIEKIDNLYFHNVEKRDKQFIFKQPTINSIANSAFNTRSSGDIHCLNCNDKKINGASVINSVTACDSFNHWNATSSILSIVEGYNGVGMSYSPILKEATFCYLALSDFTEEGKEYTVSYYIKDKGNSYLGQEIEMYSGGSVYNKQGPINLVHKAIESKIISNIYSIDFKQDKHKYYLVLEGKDIIDDIIITEKKDFDINMHVKNVDQFNLDVAENIYSSYSTRFFLSDEKSAKYTGTEMKNGKIINSSFIHWGYTTVKSFETKKDFQECGLENVELLNTSIKAAIVTGGEPGKIMTKEIFLGNIKTINNVVIKINDIMFDNMKGFKVKVLTAANSSSDFKVIQQSSENIISIDGKILAPYLKVLVEMPPSKVISNIDVSVEYLSEGENNPADKVVLSGEYVTKIYDAQYTANFRITHLKISEMTKDIDNYIFYVRATKENTDLAVWTNWKEIELKGNLDEYKNIANSVTFEGYRFFQFRAILKGADASINLEYLDLEVI